MSAGRALRTAALLMMLGLLLLAVTTARVLVDGARAMSESDAAFDRGDLKSAILHARRAAALYAPGVPHVQSAYERLQAIAVGAEAAEQPKTAFLAWQAMRAAALESRHVVQPRTTELGRANLNLARLEPLLGGVKPAEPAELAAHQKRALERLERPASSPRVGWTLALAGSFALALAGLGLISLGGVARDGTIIGQRAWLGALLSLLGAACWTLAVFKA